MFNKNITMNNKTFISILALASLTLSAQVKTKPNAPTTKAVTKAPSTAPKLLQTVAKVGKEIVIPYKKYVLANGLTIVVHEDHSDPIAYVDVTYHVGSNREQQGRSGFAHFLNI